jgi:hypothetical protein
MTFRKLYLFLSSDERWKTPIQLGPLELTSITGQTLSDSHSYLITWDEASSAGDNKKICHKIVIEHAHAWNYGRKGGRNLCYKLSQQNQVHEHQCKEMEKICEDVVSTTSVICGVKPEHSRLKIHIRFNTFRDTNIVTCLQTELVCFRYVSRVYRLTTVEVTISSFSSSRSYTPRKP